MKIKLGISKACWKLVGFWKIDARSVISMVSRVHILGDLGAVISGGGKIERAAPCYDVKHPMIIPQDHQLCRLVMMDCHKKLNYEGTEDVWNSLKLLYWVPHSRCTVRKVLNDCSWCKRRRIMPQPPLMDSFLKDRLRAAAPFSKVGVDYFGPIMVKHLRKQGKRYGCPFTCLITRAVHLEVAKSLETD